MNKRHDEVVELAGIIENKMRDENYIFSDVAAIDAADEILNLGYHKTVWHKVEAGDLPKNTEIEILTVNKYGYYEVAYFDQKNNFYVFDDYCHKYILPDIVAWMEFPNYKEE